MSRRVTATVSLALVCLLGVSCVPARGFDSYLDSIVKPYLFSIAGWEFKALPHEVSQWIPGGDEQSAGGASSVTEYFLLVDRINILRSEIENTSTGDGHGDSAPLKEELDRLEGERAALKNDVEKILEEQITAILAEQGIFHLPRSNKINFPPVNFKLEKPPHLLVISPRDRIESIREITLRQELSLKEMEDIESRVDELGVSSLVVELGGIGATFPAFVTNESSLRFTINTAAEEWLHQYLAFKPLGFRYVLHLIGVSYNYDIATMNETVASMVSREIGSMVCKEYYPQCGPDTDARRESDTGLDFNQEMREIRKAVDGYLARGEVEQAEEFMEQKREYLVSMGYHIRKLNQAYFAFHGKYADRPTSISPIGAELKELRGRYTSLKDFLNAVATMSSRQDLDMALKETGKQP